MASVIFDSLCLLANISLSSIHILCGLRGADSNPVAMWLRLEKSKHPVLVINPGVNRWYSQSPGDYILGLLLELLEIQHPSTCPTGAVVRTVYRLSSVGRHLPTTWRGTENLTQDYQYREWKGKERPESPRDLVLFSVSRNAWKYPLSFKLRESRNS